MKISNSILINLLKNTAHEVETDGIYLKTKDPKEDGFVLDVRFYQDDMHDLSLWMGEVEVNLNNEQQDIVFQKLMKLQNEELESQEHHRRMSMDVPEGYHLFI